MNTKQKETFKSLLAELRDVVPQEDQRKLEQLERIVGELRRERSGLLAKVADLASQRDSTKTDAVRTKSDLQQRISTMRMNSAKTESNLQRQIAEMNETVTSMLQRSCEFHGGLYPIKTDPLFITKEQLVRANQESIRLGYNRTVKEDYLASLPDQHYLIMQAFYHVGFSGREFEQLNYRLMLTLCSKLASPSITGADMEHAILDVSANSWEELRKQKARVKMN